MARGRSPNRDKAFELWRESGAKRLLKDIAEELGVSETLVRKWKNQDKWEEKFSLPNRMVTLPKEGDRNSNVTNEPPVKRSRGAPKGNQNRYVHGL